MNIERFILFLEEFNCCEVKNHFFFANKEGEEHVFLLEDNQEVIIKIPNKK